MNNLFLIGFLVVLLNAYDDSWKNQLEWITVFSCNVLPFQFVYFNRMSTFDLRFNKKTRTKRFDTFYILVYHSMVQFGILKIVLTVKKLYTYSHKCQLSTFQVPRSTLPLRKLKLEKSHFPVIFDLVGASDQLNSLENRTL